MEKSKDVFGQLNACTCNVEEEGYCNRACYNIQWIDIDWEYDDDSDY